MNIHLVDGTYELFRHYHGAPRRIAENGAERGAVRSVLSSLLSLLEQGATHMAVATDHVVESFRNDLWPGYKSGEGVEPELLEQFGPLEDALRDMGVVVWAMEELEADDGLASGAALAARDGRVDVVYLCTPDKDLAQCVSGDRVVQLDRRAGVARNESGVQEKFGVPPASIPDYLALVGDSADGFPGLPGWGPKSASAVLARYKVVEAIPGRAAAWDVEVRGASRLAATLREGRAQALLFRDLATLRNGAALFEDVDELAWDGPRPTFRETAAELGALGLWRRAERLADAPHRRRHFPDRGMHDDAGCSQQLERLGRPCPQTRLVDSTESPTSKKGRSQA